MNPKYHIAKRKYIYDVLKSIFTSFIISSFSIGLLYEKAEEELLELSTSQSLVISTIFLSTLLVQLILYWLILRKYVFSDQDKSFLIEKGLFFKRKINIPYKNIHTISIKRRFRDLILGLSTLQFDTGTTTTIAPEGNIVVDKAYAPVLKKFIEEKRNNKNISLPSPQDFNQDEKEYIEYLYEAKWTKLLLLGFLKQGFLLVALLISVILFGFVMSITRFDPEINHKELLIILIIIYFIVLILILIILMLYYLFKFYRYRLNIEGDSISYRYGLFNKVEFKLSRKRINAIHINQSILFRFFGYYELSVSALGIGDNFGNSENKIESKSLLLMVKKHTMNELISFLGYPATDDFQLLKPKKFRLLNFIYLPILFLLIINIPIYIFLSFHIIDFIVPVIMNILLSVLYIIGLFLWMNNHIIGKNENTYFLQKGAFTLKKTMIKKTRIQMITYQQNPLLLIEKIGNIKISYKALGANICMRNYESSDYILLKESLLAKKISYKTDL